MSEEFDPQSNEELRRDEARRKENEKTVIGALGLFFLEAVKIAILAGITIGLVRYFLFKPFYVRGQSMEPTYYEQEYLIVDELSYRFRAPERGEVVVFLSPTNHEDHYLKRIIGLPGERVKVENGKVIVFNEKNPTGAVVDEPYVEDHTEGSITVTLGDDQYFVLGDNRDASFDSRRFGAIDRGAIIGRSVFRGWPFHRLTTFSAPDYTF